MAVNSMIIMNLKLNNVLSFYDFSINFSYKTKLRSTLIDNEWLTKIPSFRYKKLNIFMGSNATGKTSLVKCIWSILLFFKDKNKNDIVEIFNTKYETSDIEIDLVESNKGNKILHRFKIKSNNQEVGIGIKISHTFMQISSTPSSKDSYETIVKKLDLIPDDFVDYIDALNDCNLDIGWNILLPATEKEFNEVMYIKGNNEKEENIYLDILNMVFKTLDPSIINVSKSKDANNAYVFEHESVGKIIIQDGMQVQAIPHLSSGTKYGINISNMLFSIKFHRNGIYLIDEQFSYVNSDIEAAILSTMVSMLGNDEQIFFTTHNTDILSLRFPFHSFYFMKKPYNLEKKRNEIRVVCASEVENRNNVSAKRIIDNDIFQTAPNTNDIFKLGE